MGCCLQKLRPLLAPQPMAELTGPLKHFEDALPLLESDPRFERVAESDRFAALPAVLLLRHISGYFGSTKLLAAVN